MERDGSRSLAQMPEIARVNGVAIAMFYADHNPPHFHARVGEARAMIQIDPPELIAGFLPDARMSAVLHWARVHRAELVANWRRARRSEPLAPITERAQ